MSLNTRHIAISSCLVALIALTGVAAERFAAPAHAQQHAEQAAVPERPTAPAAVAEGEAEAELRRQPIADLSEIRFRRKFRILVPQNMLEKQSDETLSAAQQRHIELIERFAEEQFLLPVMVSVPRWQDLPKALLDGEGDLIGAYMQIPEYRERDIPFTVPVENLREVLVARTADSITSAHDLSGREIALSARSSFWPRLHELKRRVPGIEVRIIDGTADTEAMLAGVAGMELDLAVVAPGRRELGAKQWQGLKAVPQFSSTTHIAFGVHPDNTELKQVLDDFLTHEQLIHRDSPSRTDDLDQISRRGVLRVLTRNNDASYFLWRGRPLGFEYELMRRFAEKQKLSLEMIVAPSHEELLPALKQGNGDVVATNLVASDGSHTAGIRFTRPYREIQKVVVTRADDDSLNSIEDLSGHTVTVRRSSPAWVLMNEFVEQGLDINLEILPESATTEEIIAGIASGLYEITVTDSFALNTASSWRDDVRAAFEFSDPVSLSWAVREDNTQLLEALNEFLEDEYKQVFYNVIHARYFENLRMKKARINERIKQTIDAAQLSPWDDIVQKEAKKYGFDWPLIVAIMFRESRFDPNVVSWAGAQGLMQVMPVTAKRFGITDLNDPATSIVAGVRMLSWLYHRLEDDLPVQDRTWFTLASYNAGLGHLLDARRLARELKLDPDRWFDNVEVAMGLLSQPEYYRKSRHGYVRGNEPVTYVRDIRELYSAYKSLQKS